MKSIKWWFRIVGVFYLLLAMMNLYFVLIDQSLIATSTTFPFPETSDTIQAFIDGWSPFAFEIFGLATFMLWASRNPSRYLGAVWLIVWLELMHGVLDDIYLISRGYDPVSYTIFIIIHLIIIITGILFVQKAEKVSA